MIQRDRRSNAYERQEGLENPNVEVDPQGRDKVERNGRIIYWITHKRGKKRSSQFTIGVVSEDEEWVEVDQLFGGGCVRIEELKQIAGARLRLTGLRCDNRMCEYRKVTQLVELARQEVAEAKLSTRDAWLVGFYRGQQKGILRILPHAEGAVTIQHLEFSYRFDTRRGLIEGEWLHADYALDPLTLYGGSVTVGVGESGTITPYVAAPIPGHSRHGPVTFSYPLRRGKPVGADVSFGRGIGSPIGVKWSPRFKKLGAEHDELW
ncbi:MAG: hypothetical protein KGZ25_12500 [Planctomycetes bacterium]|nr:hypothetical protein [Planctomycetota bacterium]